MSPNANGTLTASGTGEPGSTVTVTFPDGTTGTATVAPNGTWSVTSATPQTTGTISVTQTDAAGNTSPATSSSFTDTTPPLAPTQSVAPNANGTLTASGTGEPGSTVTVTFPDGSTGTATVAPNGTWSVTSATPQTTGAVSANQTDAAGNTSPATSSSFTDTTAPVAPTQSVSPNANGTLTASGTGEPGSTITVTFPDGTTGTATVAPNGTWSVTSATPQTTGAVFVTQTDAAGNTSPATSGSFTDTTPPLAPTQSVAPNANGTLTASGTGEPGSIVTVTFPDGSTGTATVAPNGSWSVTSATPQTTGSVSVTQTDTAGNTSTSTSTGFTDTTAPLAPTQAVSPNADGTLTASGTGEPGSTITVAFPDGSTGSTTVAPDGTWSVTSATPQSTGAVTVTQTDIAGNTSSSTSTGFTDTTPPVAPTQTVTPNADGTLTASGTGEPGSTVAVTFPDGSTGTATVAPNGTWSVTSATPQTSGTVSASQTDAAGNTSPVSSSSFTDTTPPLAPTQSVAPNANGTLTASGTGEPGSTITVTFPDGSTGTVTVANDGSWSVTSAAPQTTGSVSVTQTDAAGNTSSVAGASYTDTTPPVAPVPGPVTQNADGTLTATGTGEPGATVTVTFPDGSTGTATVAPDGTWSVTSATAQTNGLVNVAQADLANNASPAATVAVTGANTSPVGTASPSGNGTVVAGGLDSPVPILISGINGVSTGVISVADLLAQLDIADLENGSFGIGIVHADESDGVWQYLRNDLPGHSWTNFQLGDAGNADAEPVPAGEALLMHPDAVLRFVSNAGFVGTAGLTFRVWDRTVGAPSNPPSTIPGASGGASSLSTGTFAMAFITDGDESSTVTEDAPLAVVDGAAGDLLDNATSPTLVITGYTIAGVPGTQAVGVPVPVSSGGTTAGTLTINADDSYSFAPAQNYIGPIPVITYALSDGIGGTDTSTLSLSMIPVNDDPIARTDHSVTHMGVAVPLRLGANDTDDDGDLLTVLSATVPSSQGSISLVKGEWVFKPAARFSGTATVTYTISDGNGGTATSTHTVDVKPIANGDVFKTALNKPIKGSVATNDVFNSGTKFSIVTQPDSGKIAMKKDGTFTFKPKPGFTGVAKFTYQVTDRYGVTAMATAKINVVSSEHSCLVTFGKRKR